MSKFKVGDRVKARVGYFGSDVDDPDGAGVVVAELPSGLLTVKFDNWHGGHAGGLGDDDDESCWFMMPENLEAADPAVAPRFVVLSADSNHDGLFDTLDDAVVSAERLAKNEIGGRFYVMRVESTISASVTIEREPA